MSRFPRRGRWRKLFRLRRTRAGRFQCLIHPEARVHRCEHCHCGTECSLCTEGRCPVCKRPWRRVKPYRNPLTGDFSSRFVRNA